MSVTMEKYPKVEPELSFLQLLSNDQPANAPEVNTAASSHNLNSGQAGLQVACSKAPETFYGGPLPEALSENIILKELLPKTSHVARFLGSPKRLATTLVAGVLVVLTIIALAVGIKLGVLDKNRQASEPSPSAALGSPVLLNNTSLASCILSNGDKHIFFQDYKGTIRHALSLASSTTWITKLPNPIVDNAPKPRMHTPLAVISDKHDQIQLYYVVTNNTLSLRRLPLNGSWRSDIAPNIILHPDSLQLSATYIQSKSRSKATDEIFLIYYKNSAAEISGSYKHSAYWKTQQWHDMGYKLLDGIKSSSNNTLFTSQWQTFCRTEGVVSTNQTRTFFCFDLFCSGRIKSLGTEGLPCDWTPLPRVVTNCAACSNHDFGIFILNSQFYTVAPPGLGWVDNNQLVMTNGFHSPDTKFPFSKLGTSTNSHGLTYSYHQFDNFTLVEDVFNGTVSAWISSTNITLSA